MSIKRKNDRKKKPKIKSEKEKFLEQISTQEKAIFDLEQILEMARSLNSVLNFDRLIEAILYGVMAQLKTLGAAIFTKKTFDDEVFVLNRNYYGFDIDHNILYSVDACHPMIKILEKEKYGICIHEIKKLLEHDNIIDSIIKMEPSFFILLKARNNIIGFLLLGKRINANSCFTDYEKKIVEHIASIAAIAINNSLLFEMTTIDIMTNLKLKHYFYTILTEKIENFNTVIAYKNTISILMMDMDFFKTINDTYGHAAGDMVLQEVAKIIKGCTRCTDIAARYGGEEFVMLLDNTDTAHAAEIAERIRKHVEDTVIIYDGKEIKTTISIGISSHLHDFESPHDLVGRADKALYESKQNGRNCTTISPKNLPIT